MATTTNFGWETPDDTDLVKDGALAIRTLGSAIDTSLVDLKGGTTGQVLSKTSNTDMDFTWVTSDDANAIQNTIVDAKGDLISATGSDVPARLAVGNNGESLYAASSESTGLRYNPPVASLANPVINGGFDIWQRGTANVTTSLAYTADRWQKSTVTAYGVSRQTTSDTTNLPTIQYAGRIQRTAGSTSTTVQELVQSLDNFSSTPFIGKTVTLSFWARAGANYSSTSNSLTVNLLSGTGTDQNLFSGFTGSATPISGTATLTTTWQRFAFSGTISSTATQLGILFSNVPTGTAGANDWFEVTGVQLDLGTWTASTAPTFRRSGGTFAGELAACQRYYAKSYDQATTPGTVTVVGSLGGNPSATNFDTVPAIRFPVNMRGTPTVTIYSTNTGTSARIYDASAGSDVTVSATPGAGETGSRVGATVISGRSYFYQYVASAEL